MPGDVVLKVLIVNVDEPEPVTDPGANEALAPVGRPVTEKLTVALKPPLGVTVTVRVVLLPAVTVPEVGVTASEKSGDCVGVGANAGTRVFAIGDPRPVTKS